MIKLADVFNSVESDFTEALRMWNEDLDVAEEPELSMSLIDLDIETEDEIVYLKLAIEVMTAEVLNDDVAGFLKGFLAARTGLNAALITLTACSLT